MSPRRQRIEKVIDHRSKELDKRVAELARSRSREAEARERAATEQAALQHASETRMKLADAEIAAKNWVEANEWLQTRAALSAAAETQVVKARTVTARAQQHVLSARGELKKVELLSERIVREERVATERIERRLEDEIAALRFSADHSKVQE
jgi:flagellar export protein FliJ